MGHLVFGACRLTGHNVFGAYFLMGHIILGHNVLGHNVHGAFCLGGILSWGVSSWGIVSWGMSSDHQLFKLYYGQGGVKNFFNNKCFNILRVVKHFLDWKFYSWTVKSICFKGSWFWLVLLTTAYRKNLLQVLGSDKRPLFDDFAWLSLEYFIT